MQWNSLASDESIEKTVDSLKKNGITAHVVSTAEDAKKKVLDLLPKGAEVMQMTSITLDTIGVTEPINESGDYGSVRNRLNKLDREKDHVEMQKVGSAPEWAVGSVHAVTEDGKVIIASNTGSQLPAYAYGSSHVIWVVGTQKIVLTLDDAMTRIYDYILPLETKRARKAYNLPDTVTSFVSKLLIINREINKERLHIIFVNEALGF